MPIYEYKCDECGELIQYLQKVGEDTSGEACPACKKGRLHKVFSLFSSSGDSSSSSCDAGSSSPFS